MKKYFTKENLLVICAVIVTIALVWSAFSLSSIAHSLYGSLDVNVYRL